MNLPMQSWRYRDLCIFTAWGLLLSALFLSLKFPVTHDVAGTQGAYLAAGLHEPSVAYFMPLYSYVAYLWARLPAGLYSLPFLLFYLAVTFLLYGAGSALKSRLTGLLAPIVFAVVLSQSGLSIIWESNCTDGMLYGLVCGLVVYGLILRSATVRRSAGMELVTAALIGVSFMIKSPLVLLPPALAAYDLLSGKLKRGATSWKLLLLLTVAPYILLLPWVVMNAQVFHKLILFEGGRANQNIITGALGVIHTVEGAYPLTGLAPGDSVMLWAVQTIAAHPLVYAASVLHRILLMFTWHPWLSIAFLAGLLRSRRDEKFHALGLFAAYFVFIHALLSIEFRYIFPLWPCAALGAAAMFDFSKDASGPGRRTSWQWGIFACVFSLFLLGYGACVLQLGRYIRGGASSAEMIENPAGLERLTGNSWALSSMARYAISNGNVAAGLRLSRQALLSATPSVGAFAYAQARLSAGRSIDDMFRQKLLEEPGTSHQDLLMLKCAAALAKRHYSEGREYFYESISNWRNGSMLFKGELGSDNEVALYRRQQTVGLAFGLDNQLNWLLGFFPPEQRAWYKSALSLPETSLEIDNLLKISPSARALYSHAMKSERSDSAGAADILATLARLRLSARFDLVVSCAEKYLSSREDPQVRLILIEVLGETGDMAGVFRQVQALRLSSGQQYDGAVARLIYKFLENPAFKTKFRHIEQLHQDGSYAALIKPAQDYLAVCPVDKVAVLYLAAALIVTGDYTGSELRLRQAEELPLLPHEVVWKDTLRKNLQKELRRKRTGRG